MLESRRKATDEGFALPIAIGFGLIMVLVALTLSIKSRDDQVSAISQKQTTASATVAEGGISRTLGFLNQNYHMLLRSDYDPNSLLGSDSPDEWSFLAKPPPCFTGVNDILTGKIPNNAPANTYTVEAYRYSDPDGISNSGDETGTLIVKGHPPNSSAVSRIQQTMKISQSTSPASFPGLMAQNITLGNNDVLGAVSGNVVCTDTLNCAVPVSECVNGQPTDAGLRNSIDALNNSVVQGQIYVRDVIWPPVPAIPSGAMNVSISGATSFPRTGDTVGTNGAYHYQVSDITLSGSDQVTVDTTSAPIYFYVTGDIDISGQAALAHTCSGTANNCGTYGSGLGSPERFRIYGNADDGDSFSDQDFTLNGGATATNVFIHAPDARMGINGGSSNPDIQGAIWVREWDGSSSNTAEIKIPNAMQQLLTNSGVAITTVSHKTSAATSWTRLEATP
ncbi:hypothetical protein [Acaryochloris sp. IP29b_bin.137]|uniref:hypothetical protein n=1 Tax=Acaryochloris sp. IP29b_bin.137 TaxID=2969217 RepID=UPI0026291227|nr:hypothetical protein [Acaryochloris sp. IP29b_bin.137]